MAGKLMDIRDEDIEFRYKVQFYIDCIHYEGSYYFICQAHQERR